MSKLTHLHIHFSSLAAEPVAAGARRRIIQRGVAVLRHVWAWMVLCRARAVERGYLAEMDQRMLRDIGVTPFDAGLEARKWWWQP